MTVQALVHPTPDLRHRSASATFTISAPDGIPAGLIAAFSEYEVALRGNDVATLDNLFARSPATVRADAPTVLVGYDAIAAFRATRSSVPTRRVIAIEVRTITPDNAVVMATTTSIDGSARGVQTQLWQRGLASGSHWQITLAHVTAPQLLDTERMAVASTDPSIWRAIGAPLIRSTTTGVLSATTLAVKDLFAVRGHRIGAGNPTWAAAATEESVTAPALSALIDAGADVTGIAQTDEFAYSLAGTNAHFGTPPNPAVPEAISGGSTSGPAAAVALGQVSAGLGTDTAGSIRVPASYQKLVGIRTTHGAISTEGVLPLAPSFDTVGWITRDVEESIKIASVLLPGAEGARPSRMIRIPNLESQAEPTVQQSFWAAVTTSVDNGRISKVHTADLAAGELESWFTAFRTVQAYEAWQCHGTWLSTNPNTVGDDVMARFTIASQVTTDQAAESNAVLTQARAVLHGLLSDAVLLLPTTASGAPDRSAGPAQIEAHRGATLRMTCLASLAGLPAVTVPRLRDKRSRPVGLSLIGAPGTDHALLDIAARMMQKATQP